MGGAAFHRGARVLQGGVRRRRPTARDEMIRFLLRFLGFWILAGGFVALVVDGTRSIAASDLVVTSARAGWTALSSGSYSLVETRLMALAPWLWADLLSPILDFPLFVVLGVFGLLLMALGRGRRRSRYEVD